MVSSFLLLSTLPLILLIVLLNSTTSSHTFLPPYNSQILRRKDPSRILLVTAHPDDECLFFAPTVLSLLQQGSVPQKVNTTDSQSKKNEVFSLCLSTGNASGLGAVRREELGHSLDILGVEKDKRWIVDTIDLQDSMTAQWDARIIAEIIKPYIIELGITAVRPSLLALQNNSHTLSRS